MFTAKAARTVLRLLAEGNHVGVACNCAGLSRATLLRWLDRTEPRYLRFRRLYKKAMAIAERSAVREWRKGFKDWRAAMEFLARRFPERWSPQSRSQIELEANVKTSNNELVGMLLADPAIRDRVREAFRSKAAEIASKAASGVGDTNTQGGVRKDEEEEETE